MNDAGRRRSARKTTNQPRRAADEPRWTTRAGGYFLRLMMEHLEDRRVLDATSVAVLPPSEFLYSEGDYLSPPAVGTPAEIALAYLDAHTGELGLTAPDLQSPVVTDQYTDADTGLTHLYLRQQVNGLEVADSEFAVTVTSLGQVLSVGGGFLPGLSDWLAAHSAAQTPNIDAIDAVRAAAEQLHLTLQSDPVLEVPATGTTKAQWIVAPDLSLDPIPVRLHYVPTGDGGAALAWQLIVRTPNNENWFDLSVPATTFGQTAYGQMLSINDWIEHATYNVLPLPNESPQDGGFSLQSNVEDAVASPFGWHDTNGVAGAEFTDTRGNNVDAHLDRDGNNVADTSPVRPSGGAALDFSGYTFDATGAPSTLQNENMAQVNLFWMNNILHDIHYKYGFTEVAGNFQVNNYGRGGAANDAVQADAQDNATGGSTNNANFATPPDGSAPRMQMYEFTYTTPRRDSDLDNSVIIHEYGHGISNRLTGGPANSNALTATQSGGMGEGWSDWYALMFLQRPTDTQSGGYGMGTYVLGQAQTGVGIRREKYSFDMTIDPLTYGAYGSGAGQSTEVHNTGEIWASTLWDLNWLLINKYGYDSNLYTGYTGSGAGGAGNKLALRLVMDAMKVQPVNPSFTQARDAILAADTALTNGANSCEIWTAFARRGLGQTASTSSSSSTIVTTNFTVPVGVCGLAVTTTVPAVGSVVSSVPVDYVVNFSNPVLSSSVQGSDLAVDVVPANSVVLNTSTQATFHFNSPPSAAQGAHTISLAAGSILRASDNLPLAAFSGQFRVDALPLAVVSTSPPAASGVFTLPGPLTLDVNFNEPVDPASIQTSDLALSGLSGATVSAVSLINGNSTARFTIGGVTAEGTLTASIAAGVVSDAFGNANSSSFSASYSVDAGEIGFASPLTATLPLGSLVYGGSVTGAITPLTDTDTFTLPLDIGQAVSVLVTPTAGTFQPSISLLDPTGAIIATAMAPTAGGRGVLQTIATPLAGIHKLIVSGSGGTMGQYTVQVTLNAALESESNGGASNDSATTAQSLDGTAVSLGGSATRLAVVGAIGTGAVGSVVDFEAGTLPSSFTTYSSNASGRIRVTAPGGTGNTSNFALLMDSNSSGTYALNEAVYSVNLAGLTQATLSFSHIQFNDETDSLPTDFTGHVNGDGVAISDDGNRWRTILNAPTNSTWTTASIDLAAAAAAAGMTLGASFRIKFQQYDNFSITTDGRGYDNIQIGLPDSQDTYKFTLAAGDTASVALKALSAGTLNAQIADSGGSVLTTAVAGPTNVDKALANFAAPVAGTYYLIVTGSASNISYDAVVSRNAAYDIELNNSTAKANSVLSRQVAGEQWVLGHVGASGDSADLYRVNLTSGATLTAQTSLPNAGSGEFVNTLDPRLRVLNSVGTPVAIDENSVDGRNARVTFTNSGAAGVFYVEVAPTTLVSGTSGEYFLTITGNNVTPPAFQVVTAMPANGSVVIVAPTTYTVDFNSPYLLSSVAAADLRLDGASATSVTLVDGDTLRFNLPTGISVGVHTATIAAGAILDASGTPLTAYAGTFNFDQTAPRVTAVSPAPGAVVSPGSLAYQVTFSEPMKVSNLTSDDFSLRGNLLNVTYSASSFSFNPAGTILTLNYSNLPEDNYSLTLVSGASAGTNFTDVDGNALDGEFSGTLPSGNGTAGGNFVAAFSMDVLTEAFPTPLGARQPLGSRIYDGTISRAIASAIDADEFTLSLDAGQTITLLVTPTTTALQPNVTLVDPSGSTLGSVSAAASGQNALLQTTTIATAGVYSIRVGSGGGTIGLYSLQVVLNAAWERESQLPGQPNNTLATAQDISASFTTEQTSLATAARGAVLGNTDGGGSYTAAAVAPTFLDISSTGTRSAAVGDATADTLTTGQLAGFTFPLFGVTYNSVSFSTNGLITFGGADITNTNFDLSASPSLAAIAALWDDYFIENTGTGAASKAVFWQVVGSGANQQLIIQWNNVRQFGGSTYFTMQAALSLDGTIQFNYASAVPAAVVSSATVGIKAAGTSNPQRLLVSYNQVPGTLVGPGLSTRLSPPVPPADYYAFPLAAGETATLAVMGSGVNLELRDANDALLATGLAGATNVSKAISNFVAPNAGTYYARISAGTTIPYSLVATKNATFDAETNDTAATAQSLSGVASVLGRVSSNGSLLDLRGTAVTGSLILIGSKITLGINDDGSFITAAGGTGIQFLNNEFVVPGTPLASFTIGAGGVNSTNEGGNGTTQITVTKENLSSGTLRGVRIVGNVGTSLQLERVVAFNDTDEFVTIASRLTNLTSGALSNVAWLESLDPDQLNTFSTNNDVVLSGRLVRADVKQGSFPGGLTIGLGSSDSRSVVSAEGFDNRDPFAIINSPVDPNGASADIAIALAFNYGTLAASQSVSSQLVMAFGRTTAEADLTYSANATGLQLTDVDYYALDLTNGLGRVRLETSTPAAGPGEYANTLNPHLELYSPANVLVASGVALADGRNETLSASGLAAGIYKVRVTAEGSTQGEYLLSTAFNAAPVINTVSVTSPINEGQAATLTGAFSDNDAGDAHTVSINWGDGGSTMLNVNPGVFSFSAAHPYLDDGPLNRYPISVTVTDDAGAAAVANTNIAVNNLPPAITAVSPASTIDENDTLVVTGTFHDSGTLDTHTVTLFWGDGQADTTLTTDGPNPSGTSLDSLGNGNWRFTASHAYLDDDPTATPADAYTISVSVIDDDGGIAVAGTSVTVNNVAPTVTGVTTTPIDEGGATMLQFTISDVGTLDRFTALIDWGNGAELLTDLPAGDYLFTRQYLDNGAGDGIPIAITVTDDDGGSTRADTSVMVNNIPPVVTSLTPDTTIHENDDFAVTGTFHDPGTLDTHTIVIDWGGSEGTTTLTTDGPNPDGASLDSLGNGDWHFTALHQYLDDDPTGTPLDLYTIGLHISDDDGGFQDVATTVTVENLPPVANLDSISEPRAEGIVIDAAGSATDVGQRDVLTFAWTVFKDGLPLPFALGGDLPRFNFTPDNDGAYQVVLTVRDDDGGLTSTSQTIVVDNIAPVASNLDATTDEDIEIGLTLVGADVPADTQKFTIVNGPLHGSLTGTAPNLIYLPEANYNGPDFFTYEISDELATGNLATVSLTITPVNDAPIANADVASTTEDALLLVGLPGVLSNDTDVDAGDSQTVAAVNGQQAAVGNQITLPSGARLTIDVDGDYQYDPRGEFDFLLAGQTASDSFTYTLEDGDGASSTASVTITIVGINDAPLGTNDQIVTDEDKSLAVAAPGLLANDADPDVGDTKTVLSINGLTAGVGTALTLPSGALVTVQADGGYVYDPNGRFGLLLIGQSASDDFDYSFVDTAGAVSQATVNIVVQGVTIPNSIAGSVYLDTNGSGQRDAPELGLPNVLIVLEGPIVQLQRTDGSGHYRFDGLPKGTYTVWEYQPQSFLDGSDTRGAIGLGTVTNDHFVGLNLTSNVHAADYDFGEQGLRNPNKTLGLASTATAWEIAAAVIAADEPPTLEAQVLAALRPTATGGIAYRNPLDVSSDGHVSAVDALLIINLLNATSQPSPPLQAAALTTANLDTSNYDTSGDGAVSAIDALLVINYLNSFGPGGGEGESNLGALGEPASGAAVPDATFDLLAWDISQPSGRKNAAGGIGL